jgi:hypothetical protein
VIVEVQIDHPDGRGLNASWSGQRWVIYPRDQVMTVLRNNDQKFDIADTVTAEDAATTVERFSERVLDLRRLFRQHATRLHARAGAIRARPRRSR